MTTDQPVGASTGSGSSVGHRKAIATVMWVSLVLGVTLSRALPAIPGAVELAMRAVGVVAAVYLLAVPPLGEGRARVSVPLLVSFAAIPALGAVLALARAEPGDAVNHLASLLSLVAASTLSPRLLAVSIRRALLTVVAASLLLGLLYPAAVATSDRAFLRPVYDGRLVGLLGAANVLGTAGLVLAVVSLVAVTGRTRAVGVVVGVIGILASSSQTSLAVLVLVLLTTGLLTLRRSGRGSGIVVAGSFSVAGALVALGVWLNAPGGRDVAGMLSGVTFSRRTDVWEAVLRQDVPFLGLGQSRIQAFFEDNEIQGAIGISSVHNGLIDAYLRDGVPGLAVLLLMLATLLVVAVQARADLVLLPVLVLLLVGALEVFPTHVPWFALLYGLVVVTLHLSKEPVLGRGRESGSEQSSEAVVHDAASPSAR